MTVLINGTEASNLENGVLNASCDIGNLYTEKPVLIVARYAGNKLADIVLSENAEDGILSVEMEVEDAQNSSVKIMLLASLETIAPIFPFEKLTPVNP